MSAPRTIRQGDLALIYVGPPTAPGPAVPLTLAKGEDSGHAHVIDGVLHDGMLHVLTAAELRVEPPGMAWRHDPITVPPGTYKIVPQREYTPAGARRATD